MIKGKQYINGHLMGYNDFKGARPTDLQTMASFSFTEFQRRQQQKLNLPMATLIKCHKDYLAK